MKCQFVDPNDNYVCGKSFQIEMIVMINPTQKDPTTFYVCGQHAKMRFDAFNRADAEVQKMYDRNEINYQAKRDKQSEIWNTCRKCNKRFEKEDVIWVLIYLKFRTDIQIQLKKAFRVHRECCIGEQFLYGIGKEVPKDSKLDSF